MAKCDKCGKEFTEQGLKRHKTRKIPCDRILECKKCKKIFTHPGNYKKHINRKTTCEPVAGDPSQPTPVNTCHFCYRTMSTPRNLKRHFVTCKMSGRKGIDIIMKKLNENEEKQKEKWRKQKEKDKKQKEKNKEMDLIIKELKSEMKHLKKQLVKAGVTINASGEHSVVNYTNYEGITNNLNVMTFEGAKHIEYIKQVVRSEEFRNMLTTNTLESTVENMLGAAVMVCRGPNKDTHNVYCPDPEADDMLVYGREGEGIISCLAKNGKKMWMKRKFDCFVKRLYSELSDNSKDLKEEKKKDHSERLSNYMFDMFNNMGTRWSEDPAGIPQSEIQSMLQKIKVMLHVDPSENPAEKPPENPVPAPPTDPSL